VQDQFLGAVDADTSSCQTTSGGPLLLPTAALDPAPTDPSWPIPAADRVNVRESLFAEAFNGLLQQNLPQPDIAAASLDDLVGTSKQRSWHRFGKKRLPSG